MLSIDEIQETFKSSALVLWIHLFRDFGVTCSEDLLSV